MTPPNPFLNLLANSTFNGATYKPPSDISGLLPDGWQLTAYSKPGDPKLDKQDQDWQQPEIIPIQWKVQFPEAELVYGAIGVANDGAGEYLLPRGIDPFVLKVFKGSAPTMAAFAQTVDVPAGTYRFTCPIFPDQKQGDGSRPSPASSADWYLASEVNVWIESENFLEHTGYRDARAVPIGQYTALMADLVHPGGPLTVGFALRGRWGFANNGWFVDEPSLVRMDDAPVPVPVPFPAVDTLLLAQQAVDWAQKAASYMQAVVDALGG